MLEERRCDKTIQEDEVEDDFARTGSDEEEYNAKYLKNPFGKMIFYKDDDLARNSC